jgi:hypothetical protein
VLQLGYKDTGSPCIRPDQTEAKKKQAMDENKYILGMTMDQEMSYGLCMS